MREFDEQLAWWARTLRRLVLEAVRRGLIPRRLVPTWLLFRLGIPTAAELRVLCATFDDLAAAGRRYGQAFESIGAAFGRARALGLVDDLEAGA